MPPRDTTPRQALPRRRPWQADWLHMRDLLAGVEAVTSLFSGRVLDVGCGQRPYASLFEGVTQWVGLDAIVAGSRPDALGLAWALPFRDSSFDGVVSFQVFEHVEEPARAFAELARVLRPGAPLVITAPQAWRVHEAPHDFFRYTPHGLAHLAERAGLQVERVSTLGGTGANLSVSLNVALQRAESRLPRLVRPALWTGYLAANLAGLALDRFAPDPDGAGNLVLVARKPRTP